MKLDKKYIITVLLLGTFFINLPILATAGQWSSTGNVIYYNDGNVGIGTDVPSTKLQIKQSITGLNFAIRNDADYADLKIFSSYDIPTSATNVTIQTGSGDKFSVATHASSTPSLLIDTTGNVGLGTTSPQSQLHIKGSTAGMLTLEGGTHSYIRWYPDGYSSGRKAWTGYGNSSDDNFTIANEISGANVVITTNGGALIVPGKIKANEVKVTSNVWADYVFESTYRLRTLAEVKNYISKNKHLPGIPAAKDIEENGLSLGDMQQKQMEKIEELTLYLINLDERMNRIEEENAQLRETLLSLQK